MIFQLWRLSGLDVIKSSPPQQTATGYIGEASAIHFFSLPKTIENASASLALKR